MNKLKPFLIGTLAGSAILFVALQFHLVRSEEGFRLVPRTPQPSLGLAYVDIRDWTAEDWTDRSEVARAMVAHGSTDLIASSVSDNLLDSVSERGSALDQLRELVNEDSEPGGLLIPDDLNSRASDSADSMDSEMRDLFEAPFPRDAKKTNRNRIAATDKFRGSGITPSRDDLPTIEAIFGEEPQDRPAGVRDPFSAADRSGRERGFDTTSTDQFRPTFSEERSAGQNSHSTGMSVTEESDIITQMLFGDDTEQPSEDSTADQQAGWRQTFNHRADQVTRNVQQEVSSQAGEMASEFRGKLQETGRQAFDSTMESFREESSSQMKQHLPESVSDFLRPGQSTSRPSTASPADQLPPELKALQEGFDPFLR